MTLRNSRAPLNVINFSKQISEPGQSKGATEQETPLTIINIFQPLNTCTLIELTKVLFKISLDLQGKSKVGHKQTFKVIKHHVFMYFKNLEII